MALALAPEVVGVGGSTAFGWKQQTALVLGAVASGVGLVAARPGRLSIAAWRAWAPVAGITIAAALLRFVTIESQSLWGDELITRYAVVGPLDDSIEAIGDRNTPFLFYLVSWPWTRIFGSEEFGLRSVSALLGTATVPVAYAAAKSLLSRPAGLLAAAMTAVSPLLVWYSQEARTYAMFAFFGALSFLFFVRCLDEPKTRNLALWAGSSVLALMTHYFALFLIVAEGVWLFAGSAGRRRAVVVASAAIASSGLALLPLALHQEQPSLRWISDSAPLLERLQNVAEAFLAFGVMSTASITRPLPPLSYLGVVAIGLVVLGVWLTIRRATPHERRRIVTAAGISGLAVLLPVALALAGKDYVLHRNLIAAWVPLAVALSGAFTIRRAKRVGTACGVAACVLGLTVTLAVMLTPEYHRDDWRGAAVALGPVTEPRAVLLQPRGSGRTAAPLPGGETAPRLTTPMDYYRSFHAVGYPIAGTPVNEIVLVDFRTVVFEREEQVLRPQPPRGFQLVQSEQHGSFWLFRLRAGKPRAVSAEALLQVPAADASGEANRWPMLYLENPPPS